jgi:hypothetical protein
MQPEKNLVEEALIQMKQIEDVLSENAKGILSSTMKEEIEELVKESLNEQEDIEDDDTNLDMEDDVEDMEDEMDIEDEDELDIEDEDEMDMEDDNDVIDMRGSSEQELLKVFKAMDDEDGIIVSKDGDDISLTDDDNEYLIRLGEQISEFGDEDYEDEDEMEMDFEDEDEMEMDFEDEDEMDMGFEDEMEMDGDYDDEMGEMYEDDTQSTIDKIFERTNTKKSNIIYEIEVDEQIDLDDEDEFDMEDDMDMENDMDMEDDLNNIEVDCDNFSVSDFIKEHGIKDASKILKVLENNGCVASKGETSEDYNYLGEAKKASKFKYNMPKNGFNEKMKEGPKKMGTGKAKFNYDKSAANVDGKMKKVNTGKKQETKEASRTYGMGSKAGRGLRKGITPNRNITYESLEAEISQLKQKNNEYKKSLNVFRDKLNEVAVFNANLAYATRLFTEHSTTKKEKINILRRFDNVQSLQESKQLFNAINSELSKETNTSLNESVNRKISNVASTGSSANLIESKTYENPQFLRMKDLMGKLG